MEKIINPIVDLLKTYAFQGGIAGIAIGAFLLFGLVYLYRNPKRERVLKLYLILFALVCAFAIACSIYGVQNWKQISGSRLTDRQWAVQLETDDTFEEADGNKKRFKSLYHNLVIFLNRSADSDKTRFHLFNLYSTKEEADNGTQVAHEKWRELGYDEEYKDSASTKDLNEFCRKFVASDDGKFFICSNE